MTPAGSSRRQKGLPIAGLRIRYTERASSPPVGVTNLDQYRDL
jgi:hypothetical protein